MGLASCRTLTLRGHLLLGGDLLGGSSGEAHALQFHHDGGVVRQELVQRRVEQADGDVQAGHLAEEPLEVLALEGQQLGQVHQALLQRVRP